MSLALSQAFEPMSLSYWLNIYNIEGEMDEFMTLLCISPRWF